MSSQDVLLMEEYEYQEITDSQEKLLAILPIPSAILSIFGSVTIITITFKSRHKRAWTPYHGLLTAMSGLNVIFSISIAAGSYLFPKDTSNKVWAFGNDASCTATGFLTQFSFSVLLYQAMLGFYFLASTRYGLSDKEIAARFEPSMHCLAVGYPLVVSTATTQTAVIFISSGTKLFSFYCSYFRRHFLVFIWKCMANGKDFLAAGLKLVDLMSLGSAKTAHCQSLILCLDESLACLFSFP